jgi:hypothetical protein
MYVFYRYRPLRIVGGVTGVVVLDRPRTMRESVPDRLALAVFVLSVDRPGGRGKHPALPCTHKHATCEPYFLAV